MDPSFSILGIFTRNQKDWFTQRAARMYLNKELDPKLKPTAS